MLDSFPWRAPRRSPPLSQSTSAFGLPRKRYNKLHCLANYCGPSKAFLPDRWNRFMALTPSQRHTREWPLLVLSLALVFAVCLPLKQWLATQPAEGTAWAGRVERAGRLLLGPEQIA